MSDVSCVALLEGGDLFGRAGEGPRALEQELLLFTVSLDELVEVGALRYVHAQGGPRAA